MKRKYIYHAFILIASLLSIPTFAWKAKAHLFLAEEALKDALSDDSVTLTRSDGSILGKYKVNTNITDAIRRYPAQFRAGAIGPDAYPDILTGQQLIHPLTGVGSCYWLNYLWDSTKTSSGPERAFTAGFFSHGAGDLFGHTFINYFAGGAFNFGEYGINHTIIESYIDKSLPKLVTWDGHEFTENDISISDGLDQFIYENLVYARPNSHLGRWLFMGSDSSTSVPKYFSKLRNSLASDIARYYARLARYDKEYDAIINNADDCGIFDFSCSKLRFYADASLVLAEKQGYRVLHGLIITYKEYWRDDIDEGLKAWPGLSNEINLAVNCSDIMDIKRASDACKKYVTGHLISMAGAPDVVGGAIDVISSILDAIMPKFLQDAIEEAKKDLLNFVVEGATGYSTDELKDMASNPEKQFNLIGLPIESFKNDNLKLNTSENVINYEKVSAMVNTVNMIKLSFLAKEEIIKFIKNLTDKTVAFDKENIMLGTWFGSFDESCQWKSACDTMVLARDTGLFYSFFKHQEGDTLSTEMFGKCSVQEMPIDSTYDDTTGSFIVLVDKSGLLEDEISIPLNLPADGELVFRLSATKNLATGYLGPKDSSWMVPFDCRKVLHVPCRYKAGKYVVNVSRVHLLKRLATTASNVYYNLSVAYKPSEIQGYEPDDSITIARLIMPDSVMFSNIGFSNSDNDRYDRYDYYLFTVDKPSCAAVSYFGQAGKNAVTVFDSTKRIIKTADVSIRGTLITPKLNRGTYYLSVKSYNPHLQDYGYYGVQLHLFSDTSLSTRTGAIKVAGKEMQYANMSAQNSSQWYLLTLSNKGKIEVALETESPLKISMLLLNQDGTTSIGTLKSNDTTKYGLMADSIPAGTYYLKVNRISGSGSYRFYISGADGEVNVRSRSFKVDFDQLKIKYYGKVLNWTYYPSYTFEGAIMILDVKGRIIRIGKPERYVKGIKYSGIFDCKNVASGLYYLCMQNNTAMKPVKLMIKNR